MLFNQLKIGDHVHVLEVLGTFKKTTVYRIWELWAFKNMFFRSIDWETLYLMGDKHFEYNNYLL